MLLTSRKQFLFRFSVLKRLHSSFMFACLCASLKNVLPSGLVTVLPTGSRSRSGKDKSGIADDILTGKVIDSSLLGIYLANSLAYSLNALNQRICE